MQRLSNLLIQAATPKIINIDTKESNQAILADIVESTPKTLEFDKATLSFDDK